MARYAAHTYYPRPAKRRHHCLMDISENNTADLSPLEQLRARLRAFADRVLEAIEALPMPKTVIDGERTARAITATDRMLVQIYSKVTQPKQPLSPPDGAHARKENSRPQSSLPPATPELEQQANEIFLQCLKARAESPDHETERP